MARSRQTSQENSQTESVSAAPNVPLHTLEAAVQIAALLINREDKEPSGEYLLQKCGQVHVEATANAGVDPDSLRDWAVSEAQRRSASLDHKEITKFSLIS